MTAALRFLALAVFVLAAFMTRAGTTDLSPDTLGIVFDLNDPNSRGTARLYASLRNVPQQNLVGIRLPATDSLSPDALAPLRREVLDHLPTAVQSLLLVWSRPFAVGCMSITTAFAAGYRPDFCEPGCGLTALNPLYDSDDWLPPDTVGWWPAMLLPTDDPELARRVIERGINADRVSMPGTFYLVTTSDVARNVRSADYTSVQLLFGRRIRVVQLAEPVREDIHDAIGYFTGGAHIQEIARIGFLPGAAADHLTSTGGVLYGGNQMSALSWLKQGATGSYGTVSEPCNHPEKFPRPSVFVDHYLRGETLLEAYWKSVAMPGQGLFIGDPLARPFGRIAPVVTGMQQNPRI